jgi:zinc D-Ala-D-Ala dipeptidase
MIRGSIFTCFWLTVLMSGCQDNQNRQDTPSAISMTDKTMTELPDIVLDTTSEDIIEPVISKAEGLDPRYWVDMELVLPTARFEILYATDSNFTGLKIYPCARCFLRPEVADRLILIEKDLQRLGYSLVIYDCYRPAPYQQILWNALPDPRYVMHPSRGSNHSRGASVDVSLYKVNDGTLVDMGTPVDYLGEASHWDNPDLPERVEANRQILKKAMQKQGFSTIRTEWWHYDFQPKRFDLDSVVWTCQN